jgi:hypothetical protein
VYQKRTSPYHALIARQIRTILDFRCLASLQTNSTMMMEITRLTQEENRVVVQLTEKGVSDTQVVKWITFLTLVYLPASFVSVSMVRMVMADDDADGNSR